MTASQFPSNLPVEPPRDSTAVAYGQNYLPAWATQSPLEEPGISWTRYFSALKRYKWLILFVALAGTGIGFGVTQFMTPAYQTQGTIWISENVAQQGMPSQGPIQGDPLVSPGAWADLIKSSSIMDNVVRKYSLYLWPKSQKDAPLFAGFQPLPGLHPGNYVLTTDATNAHYTLTTNEGKVVVEKGVTGDSVGRKVGFAWKPAASALGPSRNVAFTVVSPRDISSGLIAKVDVTLPQNSQFIKLTLAGTNPQRTAMILNGVMREFVSTAGELKRRNLSEESKALADQLDTASRALKSAEGSLESFRKSTITLPSEAIMAAPATGMGAGGGTGGSDPAVGNYFGQKAQYLTVQHDIAALQAIVRDPNNITPDAFIGVPSAQSSLALQAALQDLSKREAALRAARESYTDEHKIVQDLRLSVQTMRTQTLPQVINTLIRELQSRGTDLNRQMASASSELKDIPPRTIETMRLQRDVVSRSSLYSMLQQRYAEIKLAEAGAIPDVSILDTAVAPLAPTKNTAPTILLLALVVSFGASIGLALLLDHTDPRLRYPEQVTRELGLSILGAVPTIKRSRAGDPDPEEAEHVIVSFRTIRMAITNQYDASGSAMLTVSSPGAGDGKSLVCSNLALSFAEAGYRTVLVDGDTRRGQLHAMFGANRRPGLLDLLGGDAPFEAVLRSTTHERLTLIPCGTRRHRGPELLHSQAMSQFIAELRRRYDVVVVDSPPLGAGVDPVVLAAATQNMLIVLRTGATDRKMAESKLKLLDRLPVRMLGAVLNDIRAQGEYKYYSYLYGSTTSEDDDLPRTAPQVGELTGRT
jgi:succinoglycan biosynthesis transport protein ExoP